VIVALDSDRTFEQGHGGDLGFFLFLLYEEGSPWTGGSQISVWGTSNPDKGNPVL
jgi:hypothetical protein